jgi:hypothetical protein
MTTIVPMARTVFRDHEVDQLRKCASQNGHRIERFVTEHHDEYILVYDEWDSVVAHIGMRPTGGIFIDGADLGYNEYVSIALMCADRTKLKEAKA